MSQRFRIGALLAVVFLLVLLLVLERFNLISLRGRADSNKTDAKASTQPEYADDELIIKFKGSQNDSSIDAKIKDKTGQSAKSVKKIFDSRVDQKFSNIYLIKVDTDTSTSEDRSVFPDQSKELKQSKLNEYIAALKKDPSVSYAEKNEIFRVALEPNDPYFKSSGAWGQTYPDMWGLQKIQAPMAWDTTTGSDSVTVAVIDTGVDYNLPELSKNILKDSNGTVVGYDFVNEDTDPNDDFGHGTHVAGTIGAVTNNNTGVAGVNWNVKIMPIKAFGANGGGYGADIAPGIVWSVDHGAKISSNSWGGGGESQVIKDAMDYAYSKGQTIVVAAGNSNDNTKNYYPAQYEDVITVAAYDWNDEKASFSNYGSRLDVAAPGVNVLSLKSTVSPMCTDARTIANSYCYVSGTSMATPHVSGLAALILAKNPTFTNEQIRQAIRRGADDIGTAGLDIYSGYGRINAYKSLQVENPLETKILSQTIDPANLNSISYYGTAKGPTYAGYELSYSNSPTSTTWTKIYGSSQPVTNSLLGTLDTSTLPNEYIYIKLTTTNSSGETFSDMTTFPAHATIKGKVTETLTKKPLAGVSVYVGAAGINWGETVTDANGNYIIESLPVEQEYTYEVFGILRGYYNMPFAYMVKFASGEVKTVNMSLASKRSLSSITGKVTSATTKAILPNMHVQIGIWDPKQVIWCDTTTAAKTGAYACNARFQEATFVIKVDDPSGKYASQQTSVFVPAGSNITKNFSLYLK